MTVPMQSVPTSVEDRIRDSRDQLGQGSRQGRRQGLIDLGQDSYMEFWLVTLYPEGVTMKDAVRVGLEPEVVYFEDLPEGTIIAPHAFKPQKGIALKIAGIPVGTCDIDVDDEGNVQYTAEFKRDKITPELYEVMFGGDADKVSMDVLHTNVFDQDDTDPGEGKTKPPFRLPGR